MRHGCYIRFANAYAGWGGYLDSVQVATMEHMYKMHSLDLRHLTQNQEFYEQPEQVSFLFDYA